MIVPVLSAALLGLALAVPARAEPPAERWQIVPGVRAGPITKYTGEEKLVALYGRSQVEPAQIAVGEGETEPGTRLFAAEPEKTLEILWMDPARTRVREVRLRNEGTLWKTDKGITIGTSLREIERLNGRPFVLTGFEWDYAGTVLGANGGALRELELGTKSGAEGRTLLLRLAPRRVPQNDPDYAKLAGDGSFSSDDPSMQALDPTVYEMIVRFGEK